MARVSAPVKIFYSYSHKDEALCVEVIGALKSLERRRLIADWYDRQIRPGDDWAGVIDHNLETAHIILLLISQDFISSNYCWNIELPRALQRSKTKDAVVIPISLRRTSWEGLPFASLQALPTGAKPVEDRQAWPTRDDALTVICQGIERVVLDLLGAEQAAKAAATTSAAADLLPYLCDRSAQVGKLGKLMGEETESEEAESEETEGEETAVAGSRQRVPQPLVCLIPGAEDECHDRFQERLESLDLRQWLKLGSERKIEPFAMAWPRPTESVAVHEAFQQTLAQAVWRDGNWAALPADKLLKRLAASTPALVSAYVSTEYWGPHSATQMRAFLQFWNDCATQQQRWRAPLLICLFVIYKSTEPLKFWQFGEKRRLERAQAEAEACCTQLDWTAYPALRGCVLPALSGIEKFEVEDFLRGPDVKPAYDYQALLAAVSALYTQHALLKDETRISMKNLAQALARLFQSHRRQQ